MTSTAAAWIARLCSHHAGRFYMTYIGFDGKGYQTGLAESKDPYGLAEARVHIAARSEFTDYALQHRHELDCARKRHPLDRRVEAEFAGAFWVSIMLIRTRATKKGLR